MDEVKKKREKLEVLLFIENMFSESEGYQLKYFATRGVKSMLKLRLFGISQTTKAEEVRLAEEEPEVFEFMTSCEGILYVRNMYIARMS